MTNGTIQSSKQPQICWFTSVWTGQGKEVAEEKGAERRRRERGEVRYQVVVGLNLKKSEKHHVVGLIGNNLDVLKNVQSTEDAKIWRNNRASLHNLTNVCQLFKKRHSYQIIWTLRVCLGSCGFELPTASSPKWARVYCGIDGGPPV